MKRFLSVGFVLAIMLMLGYPSVANAQEGSEFCRTIVNTIDDTDEGEMASAMNDLAGLGAEVHVVLIDDMGLDDEGHHISDAQAFQNEVLKPNCPELFRPDGEVKDDLLLLLAADTLDGKSDEFYYGMIFGQDWMSYFDADRQVQVSDDLYFARRYVEGTTAFLVDIYQRDTGGSPELPSTGGGGATPSNDDNDSSSATGVLVVFGVIVGLALLGGLIWFVMVKAGASKRRKSSQANQAKRFSDVESAYVSLTGSQDALLTDVDFWLLQLPASDEAKLSALRAELVGAMGSLSETLASGGQLETDVNREGTDEFRTDVEERLVVVETHVEVAKQASEQLTAECRKLQEQRDNFGSNRAKAAGLLKDLPAQVQAQKTAGFRVDVYDTQVQAFQKALADADAAYAKSEFVTAHNHVQSVIDGCQQATTELAELPKRAAKVKADADQLAKSVSDARTAAAEAGATLQTLRGSYARTNLHDIETGDSDATTALQAAEAQIAAARTAATEQEFGTAEQHLTNASEQLRVAQEGIAQIESRQAELERLRTSLPADIQALVTKATSLVATIDDYGSDVKARTQTQADACAAKAQQAQMDLQAGQPDYLAISQSVTAIDKELDTVADAAETQRSQAVADRTPTYTTDYGGGYGGGGVVIIDNDNDDFGRSRRRGGGFMPRIPGGFGSRSSTPSRSPSRSSSSSSRSSRRSGGSAGGTRASRSSGSRRSGGSAGGTRRKR